MHRGGLAWGATNSGKTFSNAMHFAKRCARRRRRHLLIGANLKLLRGEVIPLIRYVASLYGVSSTKYRTDVGTFTIGPSQVVVIAGATEGSEDRLRTYHNIDSIMAEELTAMIEVFYDMALSRRSNEFGPVFSSCNPSTPINWVKQRLDAGRWEHEQMFLVEDNPTLSEEERQQFEDQFVGVFRQRMIDAIWAAPEGLVYPNWTAVDADVADRLLDRDCVVGVDYGESRVTCAHYAQFDGDHWVVTKEYYWDALKAGKRDSDAHAEAIKAFAPGRILNAQLDPSAVDLRNAMVRAGIPVQNAYNRAEGYSITDGALQRQRVKICQSRVPQLSVQLQSLVYNKYGDAPDPKCIDHATDDLRYLVCGISDMFSANADNKVVYR